MIPVKRDQPRATPEGGAAGAPNPARRRQACGAAIRSARVMFRIPGRAPRSSIDSACDDSMRRRRRTN
ncbi:hypothetical protein A8H35_27760 [Burkholderia thailandensis]|nr:hypothetical protein WJ27_21290 [Burkholderia thailandensis]AVR06711.1 hypothetical protein A8H31_03605 [Burkholderia thailandensis]AWY61863.1 hypothetical protein A8H35_27760 [Burkholderia thailandensis]AWY65949.1 hypothetical protein A8H36_12920 [Burkholderia thailandensis]KVG10542.1 hypothetical protein WJ25_10415 [Burkholderia thailandensis]